MPVYATRLPGAEEELRRYRYMVEGLLGEGSFSQVVKARAISLQAQMQGPNSRDPNNNHSDEDLVAVKIISKRALEDRQWQRVSEEFKAMMLLDAHPNILKLLNTFESNAYAFFILEYCPKGDLLRYVQANEGIDESKVLFRQVVEGVKFAHDEGWVHRDLKLENLLRAADGSVRIADWGFACRYFPNKFLTESCGSIHYASPEICFTHHYRGPEVDVWSLGVTLYVLVSGYMPFYGRDNASIINKIITGTYDMYADFSPELQNLVSGMLQTDSSKRFTIEKVLSHPWLKKEEVKEVPPTTSSGRIKTRSSGTLVNSDQMKAQHSQEIRRDDILASLSALTNSGKTPSGALRKSPNSTSHLPTESIGSTKQSGPVITTSSTAPEVGATSESTPSSGPGFVQEITTETKPPSKPNTNPLSQSTRHGPQPIDPRRRTRKSIVELTVDLMAESSHRHQQYLQQKLQQQPQQGEEEQQQQQQGAEQQQQQQPTQVSSHEPLQPTQPLPVSPCSSTKRGVEPSPSSPGRVNQGTTNPSLSESTKRTKLTSKLRGFVRTLLGGAIKDDTTPSLKSSLRSSTSHSPNIGRKHLSDEDDETSPPATATPSTVQPPPRKKQQLQKHAPMLRSQSFNMANIPSMQMQAMTLAEPNEPQPIPAPQHQAVLAVGMSSEDRKRSGSM